MFEYGLQCSLLKYCISAPSAWGCCTESVPPLMKHKHGDYVMYWRQYVDTDVHGSFLSTSHWSPPSPAQLAVLMDPATKIHRFRGVTVSTRYVSVFVVWRHHLMAASPLVSRTTTPAANSPEKQPHKFAAYVGSRLLTCRASPLPHRPTPPPTPVILTRDPATIFASEQGQHTRKRSSRSWLFVSTLGPLHTKSHRGRPRILVPNKNAYYCVLFVF